MLIGPSEGLLEYFVLVITVATMLRVFPNLWTSKCFKFNPQNEARSKSIQILSIQINFT